MPSCKVGMKLEFTASFSRDLKRTRDTEVFHRVSAVIERLESASNTAEIQGLSRIKSERGRYYRIRIGDYRLGAVMEGQALVLVRFLHRRDIYRFFP